MVRRRTRGPRGLEEIKGEVKENVEKGISVENVQVRWETQTKNLLDPIT